MLFRDLPPPALSEPHRDYRQFRAQQSEVDAVKPPLIQAWLYEDQYTLFVSSSAPDRMFVTELLNVIDPTDTSDLEPRPGVMSARSEDSTVQWTDNPTALQILHAVDARQLEYAQLLTLFGELALVFPFNGFGIRTDETDVAALEKIIAAGVGDTSTYQAELRAFLANLVAEYEADDESA